MCAGQSGPHATGAGRKTDVQDGVWIAQLLEHGLLRGSFVPPGPIRELRDLTRYRRTIVQERSRALHRRHKVLEEADIKLASVATDVLGVSGRAMLEALIRGTTDPDTLADLARGALRKKLPALRQALAGRFRGHHAFLLSQILAHVDYVEEAMTAVSAQIGALLDPFRGAVERLSTIPGVKQRTAEVVVAEIGVDLSVFPSAAHLASWAALCWWRSTICWRATQPTTISAMTTAIAGTPSGRRVGRCKPLNVKATASPSNRWPDARDSGDRLLSEQPSG